MQLEPLDNFEIVAALRCTFVAIKTEVVMWNQGAHDYEVAQWTQVLVDKFASCIELDTVTANDLVDEVLALRESLSEKRKHIGVWRSCEALLKPGGALTNR